MIAAPPASAFEPRTVMVRPSGLASPATLTTRAAAPVSGENFIKSSSQKFALTAALVFFFFRFSFLHEYVTGHIGIDLHLMIVLSGICYLGCLLAGGAGRAFQDKSTWMWIGFLGWFILATAFSTWRGGSLPYLTSYLKTILPILLIIPAVVYTREDLNKFLTVIGFAGIANAMLGFISSDFKAGRMNLEAAGSIGDPNDYAAHLIFLLPAIAYLCFGLRKSAVYKILGVGAIAAALYQILSTGSRGGLVGLMAFAVYVVITGNARIRAAMLLGVPLLVLVALPLVPKTATQRLMSVFDSQAETEESLESTQARTALLKASIAATLAHPLFGIGPGVFEDYEAGVAAQNGHRGMWHETHNTYTQISSECGIPGLGFYLAAIGCTFVYLRREVKSTDPVIQGAATTLSVMMFGFCVCILFLSKGYNFNFLAVSGLAISMKQILLARDPS
ncbi:MAG: O-antigen ligase family protein [Acidobacteriaceae bacterium]|nr:O-antigen ligase family protein [Acidobacteriaceae bacterium]